ncbi:hypothetical protein A8A01_15375 [Ewingella americana]|nr:hypothetical protein A8A01_15375 [Ewingella americana]
MNDLLTETLALKRIDLVARFVANGECDQGDKEIALVWIAELTTLLIKQLDAYDNEENKKGAFRVQ